MKLNPRSHRSEEGDEGGHGGAAIFERAFIRTLEYEFLWARLEQG